MRLAQLSYSSALSLSEKALHNQRACSAVTGSGALIQIEARR
jgi:hypothetical protein